MTQLAEVSPLQAFASSAPALFAKSGFDTRALRTNALLRKDEWIEVDGAVQDIAREQLNGVADLQAAGLVQTLGGLGTLISEYEQQGDMSEADVDMAGETEGEEDTVAFTLVAVPIPIIHKDFRINIRRLEASRTSGDALDVTQAQIAARKVRDELEDMLFNGEAIVVAGGTIRGYTDHPDRNTDTGAGWDTLTNVFDNVNTWVGLAEADNYFGPYGLYVARTQFGEARAVHTDGSGQSGINRVLENIPNLLFFKASDRLTAGEAVLVTMVSDVVDLAVAQDIVTVQWSDLGGMITRFKVFAAMAARIKSDQLLQSGIVHGTGI